MNTLLGDIIKHMSHDRAFEQHYPQVRSVLRHMLSNRAFEPHYHQVLSTSYVSNRTFEQH